MPTLIKAKPKKYRKVNKETRNDIYSSRKWRLLRLSYIQRHPLCEICEALGKIVPAEDVHHKDSFNNYLGDQRIEKAYDPENLMSLCKTHHAELHKNHTQTTGFDMSDYLKKHKDEEIYRQRRSKTTEGNDPGSPEGSH